MSRYLRLRGFRKAIFHHCEGVKSVMPLTSKRKAIEMFEKMYDEDITISSQLVMVYDMPNIVRPYMCNLKSYLDKEGTYTQYAAQRQLQHDFYFYSNAVQALYPLQFNKEKVAKKFLTKMELPADEQYLKIIL